VSAKKCRLPKKTHFLTLAARCWEANSPDAAGKLSVGTAEGYRIVRTRLVNSVGSYRPAVDFDRFDQSREVLAARSRGWHSKKQKKPD
jgi:hypothetical protein